MLISMTPLYIECLYVSLKRCGRLRVTTLAGGVRGQENYRPRIHRVYRHV